MQTTDYRYANAIQVPTCKGMEVIDVNNIIRIEAISNYSRLVFSNGKTLVVAKVLRWFEERLLMDGFMRVHKTHLVNTRFIMNYIRGTLSQAQGGRVKLSNGEWIDVSKRKNNYFQQYWFNSAA